MQIKKIYNTNEINTIQMKLIQYKWNIYNANEIYTIQISNIQYNEINTMKMKNYGIQIEIKQCK